ncbi:PGF-CTERM-anchored ABC transporter substrate-binding protein [Halorussus vallis]|uniref:PGF-CTERM-anchored ABC transporter substrate-binding protein n=2 Tax=Halorussus TaxID=1070314 RepID=UPI00209C80F3|nr:PGF-CTERM-anchored ABC transporter substrate-binding protein [Halorussus vallis]USZ75042.1 PGF-CTERM-anchored ABC transporter substrate-binding protein [Halorussus vallis]
MRTATAVIVILLVATAGATPAVATTATNRATTDEVATASTALECSFPLSKVDATGTEVTVEADPERVVSLSPSAAQTMWEIGARDEVVGVTQYASYLDGADRKANVSGAGQTYVDVEKVVDLKPDLVLAPNVTDAGTIQKLRDAGITVYHFRSADSIADVYRDVNTTGRLVGECAGAEETVSWMQDRIATVREAVRGQERPRALYVFYGYTAGNGTFIDEIIETAGARNVAAEAGVSGFKKLNAEVVVERDPEWILMNDNDPAVPDGAAYANTTAVRQNQTVVVPIQRLNQPAPRVVLAVTTLAKAFHPEAYAAANATATPTTAGASSDETAAGTPASDSQGVGVPGFGATVAVVALLAALFVAGRE